MSSSQPNGPQANPAYDSEIRFGFLLKVLGGTVVGMILTCAFIYWLYFFLLNIEKANDPAPPILSEASEPIQVPGPLLLALPERELERVERKASEQLNSYAWIDEASGSARLPIARAIDKIAHQGIGSVEVAVETESDTDEPTAPSETDGATE